MRILFICLCILSFPAQASILQIQEVTSKNGVKAWLVEDKSIPVISVRFLFKGAGSVNDSADKQGLSQILSNTLDEGAGDLDSKAFQEKLNNHSISLSFSSSRDDFSGSLKTLSKYQDIAFDLLNLSLTKPRFEDDALTRMIESNLVRIRSNITDPEWMNARLTNAVLYQNHPYAFNSGGTLSSLPRIKSDDLRAKFKTQLAQDNLIVSVAGDMTKQQVLAMLDKVFGDLPKTADIKKTEDIQISGLSTVTLYKQDIPQTIISMAVEGIKHTDPDYYAAEIMDFIFGSSGFGSRLTEEIREERGLTYGIYSGLSEMEHARVLSIGTSTRNDKVQEVINLTKQTMQDMVKAPVTDKELNDAKSYLIGSVPLQLTSTDRISGMMIGLMRDDLPMDYLETRAQRLKTISIDDVVRASQRLLKSENLKIILVGNPKISDNPEIVLSLPHVE